MDKKKAKMKYFFRSTAFNIGFYVITALACLVLMPTLLMPRKYFLGVVHGWTWFVYQWEKYVLGLDFEVRGVENVPDGKSFIVAAKHQSAYETMKLHTLFKDPAIILKQELLRIPFWGLYLKKIKPIAIDRKNKDTAISSIQEGAIEVKDHNRPIIIFPQGTRVRTDHTTQERPYKVGVARIQEATELPIVPMALNTGYFWPRSGWLKRPGRVVFEFLPAIEHGMERSALLAKLEHDLEERSNALLQEAINDKTKPRKLWGVVIIGLLISLCLGYCALWWQVAAAVEREHSLFLTKSEQIEKLAAYNSGKIDRFYEGAEVSGFPGPIILNIASENISSPTFNLQISGIKAWSWPAPYMPIHIETDKISFNTFEIPNAIEMDNFRAKFTPLGERLELDYATFTKGGFELNASGFMESSAERGIENIDMVITLNGVEDFMAFLGSLQILDNQTLMFASAGLTGLSQNGVVTIPFYLKDKTIFAGPFPITTLP